MALTVGIVGLGRRGRAHLDSWRALPDVDVVGIADHAEHAAPDGVPVWRDHHRLLAARGAPDVVSVAVEPAHHVAVVEDLLDAGVGVVLVEKPVGLTTVDVERLAARIDAGMRVAVGLHESFDPRLADLPKRTWSRLVVERTAPEPTRAHAGLLLDLAIHDLHLAQRLAGPALHVETARDLDGELRIVLTDGDGFHATLCTAWSDRRVRRIALRGPGATRDLDLLTGPQRGADAPLARMLADVASARRHRRPPAVGIHAALAAHRLADTVAAVLAGARDASASS